LNDYPHGGCQKFLAGVLDSSTHEIIYNRLVGQNQDENRPDGWKFSLLRKWYHLLSGSGSSIPLVKKDSEFSAAFGPADQQYL
jgi:hypothetical protein